MCKSSQVIRPTTDGGYLAAGSSSFANGVKNENWIRKLDGQGQFLWERVFKSPIHMIHPTSDGCIIASHTSAKNSLTETQLLQLNAEGGIIQPPIVIRVARNIRYTLHPDPSGGYVGIGHVSYDKGWVAKFTVQGTLLWEHTYGGHDTDILDAINFTPDDGYIVSGRTKSYGKGDFDVWIVRLDSQGEVDWEQTFGTRGWDQAEAVAVSPNGGYFVVASKGGGRDSDAWFLRLDTQGNVLWERTFGSMSEYTPYAVQPAINGGYVVAGTKGDQAWIFKITPDMNSIEIQTNQ